MAACPTRKEQVPIANSPLLSDTPLLVATNHVCRYYRAGSRDEIRAVDDVSLEIRQGDFVGLAGQSGSGKSTLLSLLGGLDRPTAGHIVFQGCDLSNVSDTRLTEVRRRMGFVFQSLALLPRMPVWESATYGLIPRGVSRSERYARASRLFERMGIADKLRRRSEELSGGEQQRVALARALVADPVMLLADEPTSNLDRNSATAILGLLRQLHAEGMTIVIVTHDPELLALAMRTYTMDQGRLAALA